MKGSTMLDYHQAIELFERVIDAHFGEPTRIAFNNASRTELAEAHGLLNEGRPADEIVSDYWGQDELPPPQGAEEIEIMKKNIIEMVRTLESHGDRYAGNDVTATAAEWLEEGFDPQQADAWCEARCWDAATARILANAGLTPQQAREACDRLIDDADGPRKYTDGDPMYAACNNDMSADEIIEAAES